MLASASNGHELAVFGSVLGAADADEDPACGACPWLAADDDGARDAATGGVPPPEAAVGAATVAFTCLSVMTRGGLDVMIVAVSTSPEWKSDTVAGLPSRMILTPRLSMSPCENDLNPSA